MASINALGYFMIVYIIVERIQKLECMLIFCWCFGNMYLVCTYAKILPIFSKCSYIWKETFSVNTGLKIFQSIFKGKKAMESADCHLSSHYTDTNLHGMKEHFIAKWHQLGIQVTSFFSMIQTKGNTRIIHTKWWSFSWGTGDSLKQS